MAFDRVYGQERVKELLASSLNRDRLAHGYLFHGQEGVGKDAMGISLAMGLNCQESVLGGCGKCASCRRILSLEHPAFRFILPVPTRPKSMKEEKYREILRERALRRMENPYGSINTNAEISTLPIIGIDQIRGLKKEVSLKLGTEGSRVVLVSHAEQMNDAAANSLLKLLEEPPPRTILVLTTATPGRLLETIVSRCQVVRFDPLSDDLVESALMKGWEYTKEEANFAARVAGGSLQRALAFSEEGYREKRTWATFFLEETLSGNALSWLDRIEALSSGYEKTEVVEHLKTLEFLIRDLLFLTLRERDRIVNIDFVDRLQVFQKKHPEFAAEEALGCVERAIDYIEKNVYLVLVLFTLCNEMRGCDLHPSLASS